MVVRCAIRRSAYYDSVALMQAQSALRALPGVDDAGVVMATPANVALLRRAGLAVDDAAAGADDLIVAVRADTDAHARAAMEAFERVLRHRPGAPAVGAYRPRTVAAAARLLPGASVALVSVPGRFAASVGREALRAGLHVMLFSDNVPLDDEARLKAEAAGAGRLVMGPDCGTALVGGVALGFANRVRRGPVGIVAASGTGLQEVASLAHRLGGGVSHALGTGGRDLAAACGAATMRRALAMLGRDPATKVVVLVSKPAAAEITERVLTDAAHIGKPVIAAVVGASAPAASRTGLRWAATLEDAARLAVGLANGAPPRDDLEAWRAAAPARAAAEIDRLAPRQRYLRALYSGGTLCAEAVAMLQGVLRTLYTNVPLEAAERADGVGPSRAHTVLDLGDDLFTVGRLHPMLDPALRARRIAEEAADPETAAILLDVVLGEGVHSDPAGALAPAIASARAAAAATGRHLVFVASVCGTDDDPQRRAAQVARLAATGVVVEDSNARAVALAGMIAARAPGLSALPPARRDGAGGERAGAPSAPQAGAGDRPGEDGLLSDPVRVVNVGLATFAESLRRQQVPVVDLEWRPPAGGDRGMLALLERLE